MGVGHEIGPNLLTHMLSIVVAAVGEMGAPLLWLFGMTERRESISGFLEGS